MIILLVAVNVAGGWAIKSEASPIAAKRSSGRTNLIHIQPQDPTKFLERSTSGLFGQSVFRTPLCDSSPIQHAYEAYFALPVAVIRLVVESKAS